MALIDAERNKNVALILARQQREVQDVELERLHAISISENRRRVERARSEAEVHKIASEAPAAANALIYSPEYMTKTVVYSDSADGLRLPFIANFM